MVSNTNRSALLEKCYKSEFPNHRYLVIYFKFGEEQHCIPLHFDFSANKVFEEKCNAREGYQVLLYKGDQLIKTHKTL